MEEDITIRCVRFVVRKTMLNISDKEAKSTHQATTLHCSQEKKAMKLFSSAQYSPDTGGRQSTHT